MHQRQTRISKPVLEKLNFEGFKDFKLKFDLHEDCRRILEAY